MQGSVMRRFGQIIRVKPDRIEDYERIHAAVWPEVLETIRACNMRNYTIFRHGTLLFAYFEYIGSDFAADMKKNGGGPQDTGVVDPYRSNAGTGRREG